MKIGAIIQARSGSSRLPGKVLLDLPYGSGVSVLERVIERVKRSKLLEEIVVATTIKKEDDEIVRISQKSGVNYFRGPEKDVLTRYYEAAKKFNIDVIVRITSDCPCIDPQIIDETVKIHLAQGADYTSTRNFPRGLDVEVINFSALEKAFLNAKKPFEREHVCPYIYLTAPSEFRIVYYDAPSEWRQPDIRITLDTEEDYALLCCIYDHLFWEKPLFSAKDVIELFIKKPYMKLINKKVRQKKIHKTFEDELREAIKVLKLQELEKAASILEEKLANFRR